MAPPDDRPVRLGRELDTAHVDGRPIAYRQAGKGVALVLLHGFLCDSRCWRRQLRGLSDDFRVVAWDAPGAGWSPDPPESFTTTDYARCLAGFLDALEIDRAHVVGLSWGGILAQEFYRNHPKRLHSLVLADTCAGWRGSLPEPVWRERLETCLRDSMGSAEALAQKLLPGLFTDGVADETRAELAGIMAEFHHAAVPAAELAVIPAAGHVSNMEQPEAFNAHVRRFCRSRRRNS